MAIDRKMDCLYICLSCFEVFREAPPVHPHKDSMLIQCDPGEPGDERRKPVTDPDGVLLTQAPRWYLEATGGIQPRTP
jgi:hypothetical protein